MQQTELFEKGNMLFTLKDITPTPETPRLKEPFTVKGKVELFKIPFLAPIWVQARVTYPEAWWEEIIPIIGSPTVAEGQMALGGDFEITFPKGFEREGEFTLEVEVYAGPTYSVDKITLPPFPPVASEKTTFLVAGEVPPEEVGFRSFRILSYSKNDGPPIEPPGVLELEVGDRCRVNVGFDHMNGEVTGKFHATIWQKRPWDPHDEVLKADKAFSVPSAPDWQPFEDHIDIPITSAISPGTEYGLYVKIMGITGGDIFTEYLANVVTIIGIPVEGIIENLVIVGYDTPVEAGATCKVAVKFDYRGPRPEDANLYVALGKIINIRLFGWDIAKWFDEEAHGEVKLLDIEESKELMPYEASVDIPIPSDLSSGEYSLYAKITGRDVSDYLSEPLENVVTIIGPPPASDLALPDPGFEATKGTYDLGDSVPWTMLYEYKGKKQGGYLTISLGTGVYPSFFTKHTFPRVAVSFEEAMDWTSGHLSGSFTLPATLEPGQTYSVRAKLETADGAQETDTDWGVITITEVPVPPKADIADFDFTATKGTYDLGAKVTYDATYKYKGKAQGGYLTISLGTGPYPSFFTKHTFPRVAVSFEEAMDWAPGELSGSFILPATLELGQAYNVRAKLETADGVQETDTDWSAFDITPAPPPPPKADIADFDLRVTKGTYDIGDRLSFTAPYKYKGMKQSGQLVLELGTGVYPTFYPVVRYSPMPVAFEEAMDWESRSLEGSFVLTEALVPGRTYSVRAKLETLTDKTQETDTDWGVITITEAPPPPPKADIADFDFRATKGNYYVGEYVPFTGSYKYKGKKQGGYLTISLGTGVYPSFFTKYTFSSRRVSFAEAYDWTPGTLSGTFLVSVLLKVGQTYNVRATLRTDDGAQEIDTDWGVFTVVERPVVGYTLTTRVTPSGAGRVTKSPDKTRYDYGEIVTLTAYPYSGYRFSYWDKDGAYLSSYTPVTTAILADTTITAHFERI